jgi:CspA family cold shock protein
MSTIASAVEPTPAGPMNGVAPAGEPCTGTVKWFDSKKGFGFILNPEGRDVFVHFSSIEGEGFRVLKDGERVCYEQLKGAKGLQARHVRREQGAVRN